ncbi:hypothetical protein D3C87_1351220 [compost metagenome]
MRRDAHFLVEFLEVHVTTHLTIIPLAVEIILPGGGCDDLERYLRTISFQHDADHDTDFLGGVASETSTLESFHDDPVWLEALHPLIDFFYKATTSSLNVMHQTLDWIFHDRVSQYARLTRFQIQHRSSDAHVYRTWVKSE